MAIQAALEQFPRHRGLILGDVILDEYLTGDCSRLSAEAPVPVMTVAGSRAVLGGAANTASNVCSLGGHAILVGQVGRDDAGRQLTALAAGVGIDFRPVTVDAPTVRKIRVLGQQQQLLRLDYETPTEMSIALENHVLDIVREEIDRVSFVLISDYAKGFLSARLCREVIALAHRAGTMVVVDPRPQHAAFYTGCDYLTPNWKESLGLVGQPECAMSPEAIAEIGARVARRFDCHVLLTLGAKGMKLVGPDGAFLVEQAAVAKEVFDVSGAGDTVAAAFALARASGADHQTSVALATRAAGIVVGKLGTATVRPDELLRGEDGRDRRLVERQDLPGLSALLRADHQRIATINGTFDVLHAGHVHILREARRQADVLIVGLNSDASVRLNKGPGRPFVNEADRAAMLLALRDVDFVHVFGETTPNDFIAAVRPDVHVNGAEYGEHCVEADTVRQVGARLHLVARLPGLSTSELLARVAHQVSGEDAPAAAAGGTADRP
jgi:D-beta-D-heptose 7-phosphate kinase/D-beta-D-heptose 1-phosphate adenosyltransferase